MDRVILRQSLENYRTPFDEEKAFAAEFIELTYDDDAFLRSREQGHFTASAWVVDKFRTHTLLTLHRKLNRWLQLGGHADGVENLLEVAMTEAREESGLTSLRFVGNGIFDIDKHIIPQRGDVPEHFHYDVRYLIEAELNEPLTLSSESIDLAWVPFDTVEDVVGYSPSILRMLEKTSRSEYVI
ncbi:NUDIX hydrolase [Belliella sp. DSM 111904]|uniref:NUDIX hydrolase n=1 Tax=Belliella filtrata TaxID=2923435 RepID=A0ABS9UXG9_9BACT|nr:NUDIX hydrolase [Belliella filtrata]MCH7408867.1 NUDIX hydrolase [Belliella filtrata]